MLSMCCETFSTLYTALRSAISHPETFLDWSVRMKERRKTNQMQTKLFDELQSSGSPTLLDLVAGRNLELETAISDLLLSAIDKAEPRREGDHDE
jgi:hypothetical protein